MCWQTQYMVTSLTRRLFIDVQIVMLCSNIHSLQNLKKKLFIKKSFEAYMSERSGSSSWLGANEHIVANKKTFE